MGIQRLSDRCFGMHHDLHADPTDTQIGARCAPKRLAAMLALAGVQYVQTDSKGHPGYATWRSRTPGATVAPGMVADALQGWRAATRRLGLPLHSHYSGLWDKAAGAKHPDWCIVNAEGKRIHQPFFFCSSLPDAPDAGDRMCPRSPYVDELMIPQLFEMIDRYGVDGFWVDGDLWAMEPCYCPRCRRAYTDATGHAAPPTDPADPLWPSWWEFTRTGFEAYVKHYCDAVHRHKPGVRIASNWLHYMKHPGAPHLPVDWLSFDYPIVWGCDNNRCEARFLSTRGKPWDTLLWDFYSSHGMWERHSPWTTPPLPMLQQQAAILLAFGGRVLACEAPMAPFALRSGQLIPWRMQRVRDLGRFVKRRWPLCRDTDTIPQVVVLHSEHHARASIRGRSNLETDVTPAYGAVCSLLECHYGVDVMDEWALLPRLQEFPVVVAPEQDRMSDAMVTALTTYVERGGKLLLSGARMLDRFGPAFLGVESEVARDPGGDAAARRVSAPASGGCAPQGGKGRGALSALRRVSRLQYEPLPHVARVHRREHESPRRPAGRRRPRADLRGCRFAAETEAEEQNQLAI